MKVKRSKYTTVTKINTVEEREIFLWFKSFTVFYEP